MLFALSEVGLKSTEAEGGQTNMKRVLFLIATVTLVFTLSHCWLLEEPYSFRNRSSYPVNVFVDAGDTWPDETFTLRPGEDKEVYASSPVYTYTPSDLVATGSLNIGGVLGYHFWDRGKPEPQER